MASWDLAGPTRLRCPDPHCEGSVETCHPVGTAPVFGVCTTCGLEVVCTVQIVAYVETEPAQERA